MILSSRSPHRPYRPPVLRASSRPAPVQPDENRAENEPPPRRDPDWAVREIVDDAMFETGR